MLNKMNFKFLYFIPILLLAIIVLIHVSLPTLNELGIIGTLFLLGNNLLQCLIVFISILLCVYGFKSLINK
jgi:hypothetical protein